MAPLGGGGHAQQADQLAPAAVRNRQALRGSEDAQSRQGLQRRVAERHRPGGGGQAAPLRFGDRLGAARRGGVIELQQRGEAGVADEPDGHAQQEAVVEGQQRLVGRRLVAGADGAHQRRADAARPVVELAFVEQRQQRVEDRRVGLEHLVQKGDAGRRQVAVDEPFVAVVLQRLQRQRAEQLLGRREARQQPLEIARAVEGTVQAPRQFALGGARRADQQHVFAGQRRQQQQAHRGAAFEQAVLERGAVPQQQRPAGQLRGHNPLAANKAVTPG